MERFKVKPADGLIIRDPIDMLVMKPEGKLVYRTPYWMRRLKDGDVVLVEKSQPAPIKKSVSVSKEIKILNKPTLEKDEK